MFIFERAHYVWDAMGVFVLLVIAAYLAWFAYDFIKEL